MHEISDKTRGNGLVNVKSRPLSSGFLSVWSSVAWAIVIGLGYTASGRGRRKALLSSSRTTRSSGAPTTHANGQAQVVAA